MPPCSWDRYFLPAGKIHPGNGLLVRQQGIRRSAENHISAVHPGARPHVDHVISGHYGFGIVLYHQDRIPQFTHLPKGSQQFPVVALMESYTRLIQDIEHPCKL